MNTIKKQAYEAFYVSVTFPLATGETLNLGSCSVTAVDKDGTTATSTLIETGTTAVVGAILKARIHDGDSSHSPYIVSFNATTSTGNKYKYDVRVKVYDIP